MRVRGTRQSSATPWAPEATDVPEAPASASPPEVVPTGATAPQRGSVVPPESADTLPTFVPRTSSRLWVVGAHGGSAEDTVARLVDGDPARHRWPLAGSGAPATRVLLTARTHAAGLAAASRAARTWASGVLPGMTLIGLALVADAPGKLPRPLAHTAEVLRGGVPHMWVVPWVDEYRLTAPAEPHPRVVRKFLIEVNAVLQGAQL